MARKRDRIVIPGSIGGLYAVSEAEKFGIKLKKEYVIVLTIIVVALIWLVRIFF